MVELKTEAELRAMRAAGEVTAAALAAVAEAAVAGVSLLELDAIAAGVMSAAGARSSFLNYHPHFAPTPYPAVLCTSVNDSAFTMAIGSVSAADEQLITRTRALAAGIAAAVVDGHLSDISHAVGVVGRRAGYGIPVDFGGHGTGRRMHEASRSPTTAGRRVGCGCDRAW